MARIGIILMLACALVGGMFYFWNSREKAPTAAVAAVPALPPVELAKETQPVAQPEVNFGPYMADLQTRIKRQWYPPKANDSDIIQVVFKVHSDGKMSNLRLLKPSGTTIANQAALKAIENASPFRPLPTGAPTDVDIQFTFDYNVFKNKGPSTAKIF